MNIISRGLGIVLAEDVPAIAETKPPRNSICCLLKKEKNSDMNSL